MLYEDLNGDDDEDSSDSLSTEGGSKQMDEATQMQD